jgi:hypothetical protein
MTDRHFGYVVALEKNVRDDDAAAIVLALRMTKGVVDVRPIIASAETVIAEARADAKWREKLYAMLSEQP